MKKREGSSRIALSLLLTLAMVGSLVPATPRTASASEVDDAGITVIEQDEIVAEPDEQDEIVAEPEETISVQGESGNESAESSLAATKATSPYASLVTTRNDSEAALANKVVMFNNRPWYIIKDNSKSATEGTVTLLAADTSFGRKGYVNIGDRTGGNDYYKSRVKALLDSMTAPNGAFEDVAYAIVTNTEAQGKLYLLSVDEAYKVPRNVRKIDFDYIRKGWWLRTPGDPRNGAGGRVAYVNGSNGDVDYFGQWPEHQFGVRPALILDLSLVIFTAEKTFELAPHTHDFTYTTSGETITVTCANTPCSVPDGKATLTIVAPTLKSYGGKGDAAATLNGTKAFNKATGMSLSATDIQYFKATKSGDSYTKQDPLSEAPSDTGDYYAELTLPGVKTGEGESVTAYVGYTISKVDSPVSITPTATVMKGGKTIDLSDNVALNGAKGAVSHEINGEANGCSLEGSILTTGEKMGYVTVNVTVAEDENRNALPVTPITVRVCNTESAQYQKASWNDKKNKVEYSEEVLKPQDYIVVENQTVWGSENTETWYVVNAPAADNLTIDDRISVCGTVNLVLCDGAKLTADKGIDVSVGSTLNIFAQSDEENMGVLVAYPPSRNVSAAAIGGSGENGGGTIAIHGGNVTADATASKYTGCAGIGGGTAYKGGGAGGVVTIYGGVVKATGASGAGPGGGPGGGAGGTVTIYGGVVKATGRSGAGIGGGSGSFSGAGGTVRIIGGIVTATSKGGDGFQGSYGSVGIGRGCSYEGNDALSVSNGTLTVGKDLLVTGGDSEDAMHVVSLKDGDYKRYLYMMVGSPSGFGGGSELHIHELEAIDAVAATCTKAGNTAYWFCEGCGKYFADEDGTQEIEEGSWVVEPEGHTWKSWKVRAAVLGMKANTEVKVCTKCKHVVRVTTQVVRVNRPVGKLPCRLPVLTFFGQRVELSLEDSQA